MDFPGNARNWGFYRISPLNHCPIFCDYFISYVKQWLKVTGPPLLCLEEGVSTYLSKRTSLMGCRKGQISVYGLVVLAVQKWLLSHTSKIEFDSQVIRPEWISLIFQHDCLYNAGNRHLWASFYLHRRVFVRKTFNFHLNMALIKHVTIDMFFPDFSCMLLVMCTLISAITD